MNFVRVMMGALLGLMTTSMASAVSINIGSVTGSPGQTVTFNVKLDTMGQQVAGMSNNITFDPQTPIVACRLTVSNRVGGVSLQPEGCTPKVDCTFARAVLVTAPPRALRNGITLYTCDVEIGQDTALGSYPLVGSEQEAANPEGTPYPDVTVTDGEIIVAPTPTPSQTGTPDLNTPTTTPTVTVTRTRKPTPTVTPTLTRTPAPIPPREDDDACQVVAPGRSHAGWILLIPAVLLWVRRRVRSNAAPK